MIKTLGLPKHFICPVCDC